MKNFKKIILSAMVLAMFSLPLLSFAATGDPSQCSSTASNLGDVICKVASILKLVVPLLIALGVVYFIWGVVTFFINDSEEAKTKGRDRIIYGLIGFVVIFSLDQLIKIVIDTFGISGGNGIVSQFIQNNANLTNTGTLSCVLSNSPKFGDLLGYGTCIIYSSVIPLIIALAIVMFFWGVVQYVINDQEEAKRSKGKQFMIWGIIGLAVMMGVWGLVNILGNTFGILNVIPRLQ